MLTENGVFGLFRSTEGQAGAGLRSDHAGEDSARLGSDLVIQVTRINFPARVENIDQQCFRRLVAQGRKQIGTDFHSLVFQPMTGGTNLFEDNFPLCGIRLKTESGSVITDDLLPVRTKLPRQKFLCPFPNFGVGVPPELVKSCRLQLPRQDFFVRDRLEQLRNALGLGE